MSEINKNVTIQEQYYSISKGPLDAKLTPANTFEELSDLTRIPRAHRYIGLTVTVLNSGSPLEYWLVGGTTNAYWKVKAGNILPTKADLLSLSSGACTVGLEMVVQNDETNENKLTKYWVTDITNGNVTWEKKEYGASIKVEGDDQEADNQAQNN